MAGMKMSAGAQLKLDTLAQARRKWDHVYSLVEQYASAKTGQEAFAGIISRAAADVSRLFMNNGWGVMADGANQVSMLAKRGGATATKFRGLRELVTNVRAAMERQEKQIISEDKADHSAAEE